MITEVFEDWSRFGRRGHRFNPPRMFEAKMVS